MRVMPFGRPLLPAMALAFVQLLVCCVPALGEDGPRPEPPAQDEAAAEEKHSLDELPPELRMVLEKLSDANRGLQDISAKVTYERVIPLLDEKQKSKGSLVFKRPNLIALKLGKPRNEEVYTNGESWWVVSHDDEQVEIYAAAGRDEGSQETVFLDFGYKEGTEKLIQEYEVTLLSKETAGGDDEPKTVYRLKFTPRPKDDRPARYAAIEAEIPDTLWLPQVLVLHESGGEIIHTYSLRKIRTNAEVEPDVFEYEPPRGYTVLRPEGP
jgi:outer membrane lipoprotein-sorting protein